MRYLDQINMNQRVFIHTLEHEPAMKRRLLDLGFTKGSEVTPVLNSPSKGMRTFLVKGCKIALRMKDASKITVFEEGEV